jgi:hypothetical protein
MEKVPTYEELVASLPENQRPVDATTKRVERAPAYAEGLAQNYATLRQRLANGAGPAAPALRHFKVEDVLDPMVERLASLLGQHTRTVQAATVDKNLSDVGRKDAIGKSTAATREAKAAAIAKERAGIGRSQEANRAARANLLAKALPAPKSEAEALRREIRNSEIRRALGETMFDETAMAARFGGLTDEQKRAVVEAPIGGAVWPSMVDAWRESLVAADPAYVQLREQGEDLDALSGALDVLDAAIENGLGQTEPTIAVVDGVVTVSK